LRTGSAQSGFYGESSDNSHSLVSPVRNFSRALNPAGIILKSNPAAVRRTYFQQGKVASLYQKRNGITNVKKNLNSLRTTLIQKIRDFLSV
jgi:hypothetical protein